MSSESRSYSEIVEACMLLDPSILKNFHEFLRKNQNEEWLIVSDYHIDKDKSYENYVSVFTVLPAGKNAITIDAVNKGLPTKLSKSTVTDSEIAFLKELNHFTFVFVSDKTFRPTAPSLAAARESIEVSLQSMLAWPNAAECSDSITFTKKLKQKALSPGFNLKVFNHATISASNVSCIALEILRTVPATKVIYWLSDRDEITTFLDGIVYQMLRLNMHSFAEKYKLKAFNLCWFGENQKPELGKKMKPQPLAPYIRIPDFFAAPMASSKTNSQDIQFLEKEKYQRILAYVLADNSRFALLKLVNEPGWALCRIVVSLNTITGNQ